MPDFSHDGLKFHYRESGTGIPFVFQHGLGADTSQTFGLFTPPPGFRLLTFDCRAHGQTRPVGDETKLNIPTFADDLRALLAHLGLERVIVGGISMGAATALEFTRQHPECVQGLVLSRPAWLDGKRETGFEVFNIIASLIRRHGARRGAEMLRESPEFQALERDAPANAQSLLEQFAQPHAAEFVARLERIPQHAPAYAHDVWRRIAVPTLVLANQQDTIHPLEFGEEYARRIPRAEFRELTAKAVSPARHAADTQRFIADFLQRHFGP